jgi:hypothetical protein
VGEFVFEIKMQIINQSAFICYQVLWISSIVIINHIYLWSTCGTVYTVIEIFLARYLRRHRYSVIRFHFSTIANNNFSKKHLLLSLLCFMWKIRTIRSILCKVNCFTPHPFFAKLYIKSIFTILDVFRMCFTSTMKKILDF